MSHPDSPSALNVTKARGSTIMLENGRTVIDAAYHDAVLGLSPTLIQLGIEAQAARLPHSFADGFAAAPAAKLVTRLDALLGGKRATLAPSGRAAAEAAFALARRLKPGDIAGFSHDLPLPQDAASTEALKRALSTRAATLSAVVIEPMVQRGPGFPFYNEQTLAEVRAQTARFGVNLIVDERVTGFGRLGILFGFQAAEIDPDIVILGDMLTGGTLPLGAVLAAEIAPAADGPAATLTAAAANAFLDLFARENRLLAANEIGKKLAIELGRCLKLPWVRDVRVRGAFGVVELDREYADLKELLLAEGVYALVAGNAVGVTPALTMVTNDLHKMATAVFKVLKKLT